MKVLVTGATGFVGLNIVQALLGRGHVVRSYQRASARRRYLDTLDVQVIEGELRDADTLRAAMQGVDAVIHSAGLTSCNWADLSALQATNVEGTAAVLRAATAQGVQRLVYTSTTSTVGSLNHPRRAASEAVALRGWRARSPYAQTKRAAEAMLQAQSAVPSVILNPAEVIGPWDHTLQWGRIMLAVATGQLPFTPPGSATFCAAADVAQAHVDALTKGRAGQRYILGGSSMRLADFIALVARQVQRQAREQSRAPWLWQRAASALRQASRNLGLSRIAAPAVDPYRMRVFGGHHLFDDTKAQHELGYRPSALAEAVAQCHDWYCAHGYLEMPPPAAPLTTPNLGSAA